MSLYFTICTLLFASLLNVVFRMKKKRQTDEVNVLSSLMNINLAGLVLQVVLCILLDKTSTPPIASLLATRFYFLYLELFMLIFTVYLLTILYKERKKKTYKTIKNGSLIFFYLCAVATIFMSVSIEEGIIKGVSLSFVYLFTSICLCLWFALLVKNIKKISSRKVIIIILFILACGVTTWLQRIDSSLIVMACVHFLGINMLSLSLEDDSDSEEMNISADILANVKVPISNICELLNLGIATEDLNLIEEVLKKIENYLDNMTDIATKEDTNLRFIREDYNLETTFNEVIRETLKDALNSNLEVSTAYDEGLPVNLKGDIFRLKKTLIKLLNYVIRHCESDSVKIAIDSICKKESERLIIAITTKCSKNLLKEENGLSKNYCLKDIGYLPIDDEAIELLSIIKNVSLLGGKIAYSTTHENDFRVVLAIDQEKSLIEDVNEDLSVIGIKLNSQNMYKDKRILFVDNDQLHIKVAQKVFKDYNIDVTFQSSIEGVEIETYDLIFCDELVARKNALPHNIGNKTFIIMGSDEKQKVSMDLNSEHLIKPLNSSKLDKLLKKYMK